MKPLQSYSFKKTFGITSYTTVAGEDVSNYSFYKCSEVKELIDAISLEFSHAAATADLAVVEECYEKALKIIKEAMPPG